MIANAESGRGLRGIGAERAGDVVDRVAALGHGERDDLRVGVGDRRRSGLRAVGTAWM